MRDQEAVQAPNKALEPPAYSVRSAPAFGGGSPRALGGYWIVAVQEVNFMRRDQILTRDKDILGGTPVFTGTRVPVDTLIAHLKAGNPLEKFLADFPSVSQEQAVAFLELAQQLVIQEAMDARPA